MRLVLGILFIVASLQTLAADYKIRKIDGEKEALAANILKLALSKVDPNVRLVEGSESMTEARLIDSIESNQLDILWTGAAEEKERRLKTVRIPILKGLLGHRLLIIRQEDMAKFSNVNSLEELNHYRGGQGTFWGDTKVLKNAGLNTVTTIKYPNLFPMLEGGRFDYFPRAVHEPWVEVSSRPELKLAVEKSIMLIYPYAMYYYVNKSNQALHDKIYRGFEMAIEDGSYDDLFFSHPMIKQALNNANLGQRKVFRLANPYMHPDTPTEREEFWLDISKL